MSGYAAAGAGLADPFRDGWFRTGDEGRFDADGYLTLTGRLKDIVNRGGEKVSPCEVDDVLSTHPAVAQAGAFAVPHDTLGEDLAAAVVLRPGAGVDESTLRAWLAARVADVKVPSRILLVDAIPAGATGKPSRAALATALADRLATSRAPARNDVETIVVDVVREILGRDDVGVHDNFFALGGDSLQAAEVSMRLQAIFGVDLGGAAIFRLPTAADLAGSIRAHAPS
jgi:acyl carrier protein